MFQSDALQLSSGLKFSPPKMKGDSDEEAGGGGLDFTCGPTSGMRVSSQYDAWFK